MDQQDSNQPKEIEQPDGLSIEDRFKIEYAELQKRNPLTEVFLNFDQAWLVVCALQWASRYPAFNGAGQMILENLGRAIGQAICVTPALKEIEQQGWRSKIETATLHLEKNLN
jgi:hypothetical protein